MSHNSQKLRIVVFGKDSGFIAHLVECLGHTRHLIFHYSCVNECIKHLKEKNTDVLIYDLLESRVDAKCELQKMIDCEIEKVILLENAQRIYANSNNVAPYSVYKKLKPKNKLCLENKEIEDVVLANPANVVFRVAELYGPSIRHGFVHDLLHKHELILRDGTVDILYEGDLVFALEIASETNATGLFDIASGKPIKTKKLVDVALLQRKTKAIVKWLRKKEKLTYNCENFKFFKWQPLVSPEVGIKVTTKLEGLKK